jgi:hypothetical protein
MGLSPANIFIQLGSLYQKIIDKKGGYLLAIIPAQGLKSSEGTPLNEEYLWELP